MSCPSGCPRKSRASGTGGSVSGSSGSGSRGSITPTEPLRPADDTTHAHGLSGTNTRRASTKPNATLTTTTTPSVPSTSLLPLVAALSPVLAPAPVPVPAAIPVLLQQPPILFTLKVNDHEPLVLFTNRDPHTRIFNSALVLSLSKYVEPQVRGTVTYHIRVLHRGDHPNKDGSLSPLHDTVLVERQQYTQAKQFYLSDIHEISVRATTTGREDTGKPVTVSVANAAYHRAMIY